jgi:HEAT repeat protein
VRNAAWTTQTLRDACGPLPADLEALVLQLDIPEAGVRKDVLADLARLKAKARPALPAIRVLLEDSPLVAAHAAWTLWEIEQNESQAVRELVRLMHTGEPEVVQFTAYALGSLGPKALDAAPALRAERERFTGATRIHVAEALTRIDAFDQASVEVLIASLQHSETHVRWMAAIALGQTQVRYADIAVPALVGALHDQNPEVRAAAALSIGGFGSSASSAVSELQSRATLDTPSVREAAQTALACIRTL